ncbi:GMC family oxidoreductase [Acuticoccus sp. MNP-M23]|uniref:GMC family oxidoreductase n=1 Tax=Acuticoccus sp. MNP-M23 TaxID=3072793 RepID=UPI0028164528|nr:GMC family oxidoreductase [Acuticoccus sp. MNP-M23]WMS42263.1 GMC family oxidoreductase [Acuticoccus sp. MNP-M23]
MQQDFRNTDTPSNHSADIAIIGAGAAGITLARALAGTGARIVITESGGAAPGDNFDSLNACEVAGLPFPGAEEGRARVLGGATTLWGGQSLPFDPVDFTARAHVPNSGWPIPYEALAPWYTPAEQLLHLDQMAYGANGWKFVGVTPPPFDPAKVGCQMSWLSHRKNFAALYGGALAQAANVTILLNATATGLVAGEDGQRIERVTLKAPGGRTGTLTAKTFVVCTGSIETARLLLASPSPDGSGIANRHDVVGRYFQDHPSGHVLDIVPKDLFAFAHLYRPHNRRHYRLFPKVPLAPEVQAQSQVMNATAEVVFQLPQGSPMETARAFYGSLGAGRMPAARNFRNLFGAVSELPRTMRDVVVRRRSPTARGSTVVLWAHIEQAPNPDSRITLSDQRDSLGEPRARIDWRLTALEQKTFRVFAETVQGELARTGLAEATVPSWLLGDDWRENVTDFYHQMGTARMGTDPATSVVDDTQKAQDIDNLYVAGSAVFPTGSASNPTLTLLALTLRLADHLKATGKVPISSAG